MVGPLGGWELLIILIVVLLIFGPSKLPKIGQSMGSAIKEFKKAGKDSGTGTSDVDAADVKNK